MKALAIVDKGLELVAKKEIEELIGSKGKTEDTTVSFEIKKLSELIILCYKAQSVKRIILLEGKTKISNDLKKSAIEINKLVNKIKLNDWIDKQQSIKVECERIGEHEFTSIDLEQEVGVSMENSFEVSLKNPDLTIYLYAYKDFCYVGIDITGRDLSKRNYRIFSSSKSLKGTIAYALIKTINYNKQESILDPLSNSGTISIETALFTSNSPINYYKKDFSFAKLKPFKKDECDAIFKKEDKKISKDKTKIFSYDSLLRNIHSSKKNAKIAGVEKLINFSKTEIDWLDTKFNQKTIDKIAVFLPSISKRVDASKIKKLYEEFFYQAKFILKETGLIGAVCLKKELLEDIAKKNNFILKKK